ncbi:MAG: hypothetical protein HEP71_10385 [Roseivirga sp.]|nr:hypothetical protein [Roseivirga sp.]
MRNGILILCLGIFFQSQLFAQDSTRNQLPGWGSFLETNLFVGYNFSPTDDGERTNYHSIEVGLWQGNVQRFLHPASISWYFSQELGISSKNLIHGSKLGISASAMFLTLGAELTHHTDYRKQIVAISPYFGIGGYPFKFTVGWRGKITGKDFKALSPVNVNASFAVWKLKSKKIDK